MSPHILTTVRTAHPENPIESVASLRPTPSSNFSVFGQQAGKSELPGATLGFLPEERATRIPFHGPAGDWLPPDFTELQKATNPYYGGNSIPMTSYGYFCRLLLL